jgi:hypothetical protein
MHEALPANSSLQRAERNWFDAKGSHTGEIWIISSMAISNPIQMSTVFLAALQELALCPMALVPYFRQAPDRRLCFGAEETVPRE